MLYYLNDANVTLYTGRELDPETGLYYYWNRYYGGELGRFLIRDRISYRGGFNVYAYVRHNPGNELDPQGLAADPRHHWFMAYHSTRSGRARVNAKCQSPRIDINSDRRRDRLAPFPPQWSDKELSRILRQRRRRPKSVDTLVKVRLLNGAEPWILLHLEIQSGREAGWRFEWGTPVYWSPFWKLPRHCMGIPSATGVQARAT